MSNNSTGGDITGLLPPSLDLPPHLSAHKYFFVCTLTVAAWDTLVLSPRTWKLFRSKGWPFLKIIYHVIRLLMPVEFAIVAVAFFDTKWTEGMCQNFYLFEPITTAILITFCSLVHVIRISAIYPGNVSIKYGMYTLLALQVIAMGVTCGFYRPMPLEFPSPPSFSGQGCIAGPKYNVREAVGVYWVLPTLLYTVSFALALMRSIKSLSTKQLSPWKLMLRDGLNLYGAIWIVNMVNMLFWFIARPTNEADTIKTIVTSMAAVLTTTMTMRIILSIRGGLANGGSFHGMSTTTSHSASHSASHSRGGLASGNRGGAPNSGTGQVISFTRSQPQTFTLRENKNKGDTAPWPAPDTTQKLESSDYADDADGRSASSIPYKNANNEPVGLAIGAGNDTFNGVKVTIDRQVDDSH